jgi:hypothetical protein
MGPSRFERDIVRTKIRYVKAADRFTRALTEFKAADVPIGLADDSVPHWTVEQRDAGWRAADAFADLVTSHRAWERLLEQLGHQR